MARVARLAGALLAETRDEYFLVGMTKEPCDFHAVGFAPTSAEPSAAPWFARLEARHATRVMLASPFLTLPVEGEALARLLADRFVVERNGSVSERLWRLVLAGGDPDAEYDPASNVDARWLVEIPGPFWKIVRDTVLRCL